MTAWLEALADRDGLREIPGPDHHPVILDWGRAAGIHWWNNDEDAWCAVAVNGVLVETGYPSTKSALARSFMDYGTALAKPIRGAIVVFPRGSQSWMGHVGIVDSVNADGTVTIWNGNVSNMVKRSIFRISAILPGGIRWPPGAPLPDGVHGGSEAPAHTLGTRMLRRGDTGPDVEELQTALDALGLMDNDESTAIFGPSTEDAVRAFQRDAKLDRDGVVGPATLSAMLERVEDLEVREAAKDVTKNAGGPAIVATGVGGVVTTIVATARDVAGLSDSAMFGTIVGSLVLIAVVGVGAYYVMQRRAASRVGLPG